MMSKQALSGVKAGVVGGIAFGAMMGMMGMLPMVGKLVGSPNAFSGFFLHIIFSAIIGYGFALFVKNKSLSHGNAITYGLVYGAIWWVLGPLLIMPLWMGMGTRLSLAGAQAALPSLFGHLAYGFVLGIVYAHVNSR